MSDMNNIEQSLRAAARRSGLSMKAMADRGGIPYAAVHNFVTDDERTVTLTTAAKLAAVLGLELRPVKDKGTPKRKPKPESKR